MFVSVYLYLYYMVLIMIVFKHFNEGKNLGILALLYSGCGGYYVVEKVALMDVSNLNSMIKHCIRRKTSGVKLYF